MTLHVRPYYPEDLEMTERWRASRGQPKLPQCMFPRDGVIVFDKDTGEECCAAWLFKDSTGLLCWMAWTVTNPDIPAKKAFNAIYVAQDYLESISSVEGYKVMIGMFHQMSMVRFFQRRGFTLSDEGHGHFLTIKEIGDE